MPSLTPNWQTRRIGGESPCGRCHEKPGTNGSWESVFKKCGILEVLDVQSSSLRIHFTHRIGKIFRFFLNHLFGWGHVMSAAGSKVLGATFSRKINLLISKEPAMMNDHTSITLGRCWENLRGPYKHGTLVTRWNFSHPKRTFWDENQKSRIPPHQCLSDQSGLWDIPRHLLHYHHVPEILKLLAQSILCHSPGLGSAMPTPGTASSWNMEAGTRAVDSFTFVQ